MSEITNQKSPDQQATKEAALPVPGAVRSPGQQERLAAWLQFPRRIVLLLVGFAMATCLIGVLPGMLLGQVAGPRVPPEVREGLEQPFMWWWQGTSVVTRRPVTDLLGDYLPNSLLLLGTGLLTALLFALVMALLAALVHWLEKRVPALGSILKGLGRLICFGGRTAPVFVLGMLLIYVFAIQLELLPAFGMLDPAESSLGDRLQRLILPTLALAYFPSLLAAQAAAREATLAREGGGWRIWLGGLLRLLATLFGQIGGLLSALSLVEVVFNWPGVGRLAFQSALRLDLPAFMGALGVLTVLVLLGRIIAELFRWLERFVRVPILIPQPEPTRWRRTARLVWVILALVLLLLPLGLAVAGLAQGEEAYMRQDFQATNEPPSPEHPWGTDRIGRDVQARVLRGTSVTLGMSALAAVIVLLPGLLCGGLLGFLADRRVLWAESLADLLLLPADTLLFLPALPAALLTVLLLRSDEPAGAATVGLVAAMVILPRAVRFFQTLWLAAPQRKRWLTVGLAGTGALLLGVVFAGIWLSAAVDLTGFGVAPPTPTLGSIVGEGSQMLISAPHMILAPGIVLWLCAFVFYTAADALVGFFHTKEAMVRLNE